MLNRTKLICTFSWNLEIQDVMPPLDAILSGPVPVAETNPAAAVRSYQIISLDGGCPLPHYPKMARSGEDPSAASSMMFSLSTF
jgi:hypothetical protein